MLINETERSNHSQNIKIFQPKLLKLNKEEKIEQVKFNFYPSQKKDREIIIKNEKKEGSGSDLLENIEKLFLKHSSIINQKNLISKEQSQNLTKETQIEIHPLKNKINNSSNNKQVSISNMIENKNILPPGIDLKSLPLEISSEENYDKVEKEKIPSNKFSLVINTRNEIKHSLLNDQTSVLNQNSILKKTLDCLKGDKIEAPQENFIQVKELTLTDINVDEMQKAKNILNLERQFKLIKNNHEETIMNHVIKSSQKQQEIFNELLVKSQTSMNNIEKANKISEDLINQLKIKMEQEFTNDILKEGIERLNITLSNLDSIQSTCNNISQEQNFLNANQRLKMIEENNKRAEIEVIDFLKSKGVMEESSETVVKPKESNDILSDEAIEKLYKKFKPNFKKSKSKLIQPTFNKFKLK